MRQYALFRRAANAVDILWLALNQPWFLLACSILALLLAFAALLLPQLPGQLNDEPAAAARWLLNTSGNYSASGELLRSLGLFNVLHSRLLRFLLALLAIILLVQISARSGALLARRRLLTQWQRPTPLGSPIPVAPYLPLFRQRLHLIQPVDIAGVTLANILRHHFAQYTVTSTKLDLPSATSAGSNAAGDGTSECRWLLLSPPAIEYLRLIALCGLLAAIVTVFYIISVGWQVTTPLLAPTDTFWSAARDLELAYHPPTAELPASVQLIHAGRSVTHPVGSEGQFQIGNLTAVIDIPAPGLLISTATGNPELLRLGQAIPSDAVGLSFPLPGTEDTVLLPEAGIGLRLVRSTTAEEEFLVEVYQSDAIQPAQRLVISQSTPQTITINPQGLALHLLPQPALRISVRYVPALWLVILAFAVMLAGAAGFWRRPSFGSIQLMPWISHDSVLILQSTSPLELDRMVDHVMEPFVALPHDLSSVTDGTALASHMLEKEQNSG
jgi:hypothetical protein